MIMPIVRMVSIYIIMIQDVIYFIFSQKMLLVILYYYFTNRILNFYILFLFRLKLCLTI